ncbi:MAG: hypothetical protein R2695_11695 [Acidimicrobiales bacterium]
MCPVRHGRRDQLSSRTPGPARGAPALALDWDCKVAINTDAHATGQLEWQPFGADKAVRCGVPVDQIVNTWSADDLLAWTAAHAAHAA